MIPSEIIDKVLFVGPTINGKGGMASLLKMYRDNFRGSSFVSTNSRFGTLPGALVLLKLLLSLPYYRRSGIKILHIHGATGKSWYRKSLIIRLGRLLGFKIILHFHGGSMKTFAEKTGKKNIKKIMCLCDEVVVLSEAWKDYFENELGCKSVSVVNNIIEDRSGIKKPASDKINFLFLGVLEKNKGLYELIEVVRMLDETHRKKCRFVIAGKGSEEETLKSMIEKYRLSGIVDMAGWVSGEEKERLLVEGNVILLPSYFEGMPISVLEGMSAGMGVIATPVGGIPEIVEDGMNGYLVPPKNVEQLRDAIVRYIDTPSLIDEHSKISAVKLQPFFAKTAAMRLEEIYKRLLGC